MIEAKIERSGGVYTLTVKGHANAERNEKDHDLVCCAVSILAQTLGVSCVEVQEARTMMHQEKGDYEVRVFNGDECRDEILPRFVMAADGLMLIEEQYPDNIRLTVSL